MYQKENFNAYRQRNDEVAMDVNEKGAYDEVLHVNQQQNTEDDSLELSIGMASPKDIDKSEENSTKDSGPHEIPVQETPEKHAGFTFKRANPEAHHDVLMEMEAEALVSSSEAQRESPLNDIESYSDKHGATDSPAEVKNCCRLENDPSSQELAAEDGVDQSLQDIKDTSKGKVLPPSPIPSQSSLGNDGSDLAEGDKRLREEYERLREAMQKLIEAGNEQLAAISSLSGRVKDLEKKLRRRNKLKMRGQHGPVSLRIQRLLYETIN